VRDDRISAGKFGRARISEALEGTVCQVIDGEGNCPRTRRRDAMASLDGMRIT